MPDVKTVTTTAKDGNVTTITTTTTKEYETVEKELKEVEQQKQKLQKGLNGGQQSAPTDNGLSSGAKTPEQEANLAKLADAKKFMQTEDGAKLAQSMLDQQGSISNGQKKWLKKQGVDADAFVQEWNKSNPKSANNKTHNAQAAAENKDDMGALANAHLGEDTNELPQGRAHKKDIDVRNPEKRNLLQKLFTKKEKQVIADDQKFSEVGGTKVKIHSAQDAERKSPFLNDVSDDIAQEGQEYLNSFQNASNGKRRVSFKEIDENGNVKKTKVSYNKDGSVKKVKTQSDSEGTLTVRAAKDGHISIKGNLQSENIMFGAGQQQVEKIVKHVETNVEKTVIEECDDKEPISPPTPPKPPTPPTPPTPPNPPTPPVPPKPQVTPIQGGLVADFVNDDKPNGFGSVQGSTIRSEYKAHGPQAMAIVYCGYEQNSDCPDSAKKMWPKDTARMTNKYNAEHIAQSLINDSETKKVNETDLASFITELRRTKNNAGLSGVKEAVSRHNNNVIKLAKTIGAYDEKTKNIDLKKMQDKGLLYSDGTRMVNQPITGKEMAVVWLLQQTNL